MKLTAAKPGVGQAIYIYWFVADHQLTASHGERMWRMARELILTGTLQRWGYVSYLAAFNPGNEDLAFAHLKELIAESVPEFQLATGPALSGQTAALEKGTLPGPFPVRWAREIGIYLASR